MKNVEDFREYLLEQEEAIRAFQDILIEKEQINFNFLSTYYYLEGMRLIFSAFTHEFYYFETEKEYIDRIKLEVTDELNKCIYVDSDGNFNVSAQIWRGQLAGVTIIELFLKLESESN